MRISPLLFGVLATIVNAVGGWVYFITLADRVAARIGYTAAVFGVLTAFGVSVSLLAVFFSRKFRGDPRKGSNWWIALSALGAYVPVAFFFWGMHQGD